MLKIVRTSHSKTKRGHYCHTKTPLALSMNLAGVDETLNNVSVYIHNDLNIRM